MTNNLNDPVPVTGGCVIAFDDEAALMLVPASFGGGFYDAPGQVLHWLYVLAFEGDDGELWAAPSSAVPLAGLLAQDVVSELDYPPDECPFLAVCMLLPPDLTGAARWSALALPLAISLMSGLSDVDRARLERSRRAFGAASLPPLSSRIQ